MLAHLVTSSLLTVLVAVPPAALPHDSVQEELIELRRQAATSPAPARLHLAIAELERREGRLGKARAALKLAERSGAKPVEIEGQLAACAMAEGDLEESEYLFTLILRAQPTESRWQRKRAEVRLRAKRYLAAACDLAAVRGNDPTAFSQEDELGLANALAVAGHLEASVSSIDRAVASGRESAVLVQRAIELELESGDLESALTRTQRLVALGVAPYTVAGLRGDIHLALGRPGDAQTEWRAATTALRRTLRKRQRSRALRLALAQLENKLAGLASSLPAKTPQ